MTPHAEPLLANVFGYTAGAVVFGIFLILLLRDRAGRRLPGASLTVAAAAVAFLWNAGALALMAFDSTLLLLATTAAMSLLPALLLDLLLDTRFRPLAWCGYALSVAAMLLHASERFLPGDEIHRRTLQATAAGFALLTVASIAVLRRRGLDWRRAAAAMALLLFALSFTHLHGEGAEHAWLFELAVHHAGVPLALLVLMQDYRFVLLDAFLRFLASILLAALCTWGAAEFAHRAGWVDYTRLSSSRIALMAVSTCAALVLFALLRSLVQHALTRLVLHRGDVEPLIARLRRQMVTDEPSYLEWAANQVAAFFAATREPGSSTLPFALGRRAGGRAYLSEDRAVLTRLEAVVNERMEQFRQEHSRRLLREAELRALQAQIHPHFLFNALNALYGSIPKQAAGARRTVLNLADIFRYFLDTGRPAIALEREIAIVRAYLEIEALRLGDKLHSEIDVDPRASSVLIPALSVQPLVENAVRHGVAPQPAGGTVRVIVRLDNNQLDVRVRDTGPGFSGKKSEGVGLENVRERLRLRYGAAARVEVERCGAETVVGFRLPVTADESADR